MKRKWCPKWWCGGTMREKKVRHVDLKYARVTTLKRYCSKCGWCYTDYRVTRRKAVEK